MSIDENKDNAPYPGLRPYREDEKAKFFGRDVDAEILIDKVLTNRLTLLFAASGVGKSSLLQAAVIPHLKSKTGENLTVVYHTDWVSDPVRSVRDAVLQALRVEGLLPEHSEEAEFGEKLPDLLAFCEVFVRPPLVLILDQFEEFFRYQRHQTGFRELIDQLTTIITDKSLPVHLILSMREDFALELNAFKPKLPTILFENFYRLEKLGRQAVRDAIIRPIENTEVTYENGLADLILNDLSINSFFNGLFSIHERLPSEKIELAYLQVVCSFLWRTSKARCEKIISTDRYLRSGCTLGILGKYLGILHIHPK
uniref:HEAT repeat n=1 Tax=uncultured Thiotrichaceae bacterium TaxID=298394 RepID=A0A6S6UE52_9GAMM|nr:MAG: HEAT repeat [uncultured Thiotrichaceae bacterium]